MSCGDAAHGQRSQANPTFTRYGAQLPFERDADGQNRDRRMPPFRRRHMSSDAHLLTAEDLEFLQRPLYGFVSVAAGPVPPQPRPVWFEATAEGTIQLFTGPDTLKVRRLRRDPRASIVVPAPVGERERWVSAAGRTTIESDGARDLCVRLAARYWDLDDPIRAKDLEDILAEQWVRLVIHPENVSRYTM